MNKQTLVQSFAAVLCILAVIGLFVFASHKVYANPSQFTNTTQSATATSSMTYISTPGTATSSVVHDTFTAATGNNYTNNTTELLVLSLGSSTATQLNMNLEYSNGYPGVDCVTTPAACDWYQDTFTNVANYATTTMPLSLVRIPQYQWPVASSTIGQITQGGFIRDSRAISISVPTRYVRAVFTSNPGGGGVAYWAQFVPSKEVR